MNQKMGLSSRVREITAFHVMEILARAKVLEAEGRDIIHMEIGEPDFPTPPLLIEAAQKALLDDPIHYTPAAGDPHLRQRISDFYANRYNVKVKPDRIFIVPGASGGFLLLLGLLIEAGHEVLLSDPGYPCYPNFVRLFGGVPRWVPVGAQTDYNLNSELVEASWSDRTQGVVIASPSNPTGTVMDAETLKALASTVKEKGGFLISDEIYHGLSYGVPTPTVLQFDPEAFVINSFSKYFGMTGWRLGWCIVPDDFKDMAERLAQNLFISAPTLSQRIAVEAFSEKNLEELERRRMAFDERRKVLMSGLESLGFGLSARPDGAFYIYADTTPWCDDSEILARRILETQGVAVTPGMDFGVHDARNYLRFAYTASTQRIEEALDRLEDFKRRFL